MPLTRRALLVLCLSSCQALRLEPSSAFSVALEDGERKWDLAQASPPKKEHKDHSVHHHEHHHKKDEQKEDLDDECHFKTWGSTRHLEGVQLLPQQTHLKPMPFEDFDHGSDNKEGLFVYPNASVAMCMIEKNGCSSWSTIFNKLTRGMMKIKTPWYGIVPFHWSAANAHQVFSDHKSTRIVWVRDPLERFLSGFLDKCAVFHDFNYYHICSFHWRNDRNVKVEYQEPGFPLSQVQRWFKEGNRMEKVDSHFTPQSWHCELKHRLEEYSLIGLMTKANFARDAACILKSANLAYVNEQGGIDGQPFFTKPSNPGSAEWQNTEIMKKFFTKEFARFMMNLYEEDYKLFRLKTPEWIDQATGEWFDVPPAQVQGGLPQASLARHGGSEADGEEDDLVTLAARAGFVLPEQAEA